MEGIPVKMRVDGVSKSFSTGGRAVQVLNNISLGVRTNEFLVLLGPGRCGKTVLMNIMDGLMAPDSGAVLLDDKPLTAPNPQIGFVFQRTGLLPWKTVLRNVEIGMKARRVPKRERRDKAMYFIDLVGLKGFENHYPRQLSGGMKQRVGIARAYANDSAVLLMDEPFGALDAQTRYAMEREILRMWEKEKRTVVFVTNNLEEAIYLGDRIVLLSRAPCTVKREYIPDLPRPRDNMDSRFLALRDEMEGNMELAL